MSHENNVIQFPVDRVEKKTAKLQSLRKNRQSMLAAGLGTFIFTVTLINTSLTTNRNSNNDALRGIASVHEVNAEWEKELVNKLSKTQKRELASLGRPATLQERIEYDQVFAGKYHITLSRGKLVAANFIAAEGRKDFAPNYLENPFGFMKKHQTYFPGQNINGEPEITKVDGKTIKKYSLLDAKLKKVADVSFQYDSFNRLLSIKVQSLN